MAKKLSKKDMIKLTENTLEIIRTAALAGFPIYAKRVSPQHILVKKDAKLQRIFFVRVLYNPNSMKPESIALSLGYDYGETIIAHLDDENKIAEKYPWNVPRAIAQDPLLLDQFSADVWSKRLIEYFNQGMSIIDSIGGYEVLLNKRGDCIALRHLKTMEIHAWINLLLKKTEYSVEWIAKWTGRREECIHDSLNQLKNIIEEVLSKYG